MTIQDLELKVREEIITCGLDTDIPDWFVINQSGFYKRKNVTITLLDSQFSDAMSVATAETYEEAYLSSLVIIKEVLRDLKDARDEL